MTYAFLYIVIIVIAVIGGVGTFLIGNSKENSRKNPEYDRRTKHNLGRLSIFYIVAFIVSVSSLAIYLSTKS